MCIHSAHRLIWPLSVHAQKGTGFEPKPLYAQPICGHSGSQGVYAVWAYGYMHMHICICIYRCVHICVCIWYAYDVHMYAHTCAYMFTPYAYHVHTMCTPMCDHLCTAICTHVYAYCCTACIQPICTTVLQYYSTTTALGAQRAHMGTYARVYVST